MFKFKRNPSWKYRTLGFTWIVGGEDTPHRAEFDLMLLFWHFTFTANIFPIKLNDWESSHGRSTGLYFGWDECDLTIDLFQSTTTWSRGLSSSGFTKHWYLADKIFGKRVYTEGEGILYKLEIAIPVRKNINVGSSVDAKGNPMTHFQSVIEIEEMVGYCALRNDRWQRPKFGRNPEYIRRAHFMLEGRNPHKDIMGSFIGPMERIEQLASHFAFDTYNPELKRSETIVPEIICTQMRFIEVGEVIPELDYNAYWEKVRAKAKKESEEECPQSDNFLAMSLKNLRC